MMSSWLFLIIFFVVALAYARLASQFLGIVLGKVFKNSNLLVSKHVASWVFAGLIYVGLGFRYSPQPFGQSFTVGLLAFFIPQLVWFLLDLHKARAK